MSRRAACPCGNPLQLAQCCGRYLGDFAGTPAPDAESLMRSRYTAFVLIDTGYLLATWHPQTRPAELELDAGAKWLGLDVRDRKAIDDTHAEVEFVARYREPGGKAVRLHERSRFVQQDGRWFYLDAAPT